MPGSYRSFSDDPDFDAGSVADENNLTVGIGLSNPKLTMGRRIMLDLVDKLHNTGVNVDIDLPQIAVIGSQSAGKSSLIESISGITLPRASGTCTRCPIECRLSRKDGPWHCAIFLRFLVDPATGQPAGQARNVPFGEVIYEKSGVEDRIRRAQHAILNPTRSPKEFLDNDKDEIIESELSFSSNCVSIQISGPDVADLSFCDLPGLIATTSSGKGVDDARLIVALAESYIKKESCIILLTVTCETDFENQPAHGLANKWDPRGQRTIGVLTKPDRIPSGEEAYWLQFIRNEKEALKNNWFCVKQPSSSDLKANITPAQARQSENNFFASTSPWCDLDATYQKYIRTDNLVVRLSIVLSDLILKRIPEIEGELERSIIAARKALSALPPPPSDNPQSEIAALLHRFTTDLSKHVEGIPGRDGLLQVIRPAQQKFREAIRETAPNFRPFERQYEGSWHMARARFLVDEEGKVWDGEDSEDEGDPRDRSPHQESCGFEYREAFGMSLALLPSGEHLSDYPGDMEVPTPIQVTDAKVTQKNPKIYIDEVMQKANESLTRELPGHFPYSVQKNIIEAIIRQWHMPATRLCETVHEFISEHVQALVSHHFAHFGQGTLAQRVRVIMNKHIQDHLTNARAKISWLLALEAHPFSLNTHYFSDYRSKFITHYRGQRHQYANPELKPTIEAFNQKADVPHQGQAGTSNPVRGALTKVMAALAEMSISVNPEKLQRLLDEDEMEPALGIMADVRAYFQVAYKRVADTVPLAIDLELVRGVGAQDDVLSTLYTHLGMNDGKGRDTCKELAQESPQISDKRTELEKRLERLEGAYHELLFLGA